MKTYRTKVRLRTVAVAIAAIVLMLGAWGMTACNDEEKNPAGKPSLTIAPASLIIGLGETAQLTATAENTGEEVTWATDNAAVVSVDANGLVSANGLGTAVVTASSGDLTAECAVTVEDRTLFPSLKLSQYDAVMRIGSTLTITPTVMYNGQEVSLPDDLSFTSSDPETVSVEKNVTGRAILSAHKRSDDPVTITAQATYLDILLQCKLEVTVTDDVVFNLSENDLKLAAYDGNDAFNASGHYDSCLISVEIEEEGTPLDNPSVQWESGDVGIVKVTDGYVEAVAPGVTTVTARFISKGGQTFIRTCEVEVYEPVLDFTDRESEVFKVAADGTSTIDPVADYNFTPADPAAVKVFDVTDGTAGTEITLTVEESALVLDRDSMSGGIRTIELRETDKYRARFTLKVVNKVLKTADDVVNFQSYTTKEDITTWQGNADMPLYKYGGYFELADNIDLTGRTLTTDLYVGYTSGNMNVNPWEYGFTGIFEGNGYALSGGTYGRGGMFGSVAVNGIVRNVAFSDCRLDLTEAYNHDNAQSVIGTSVAGLVENCLFDIAGTVGGNVSVGGVARQIAGGTLTDCVVVYSPDTGCAISFYLFNADPRGMRDSVINNVYVLCSVDKVFEDNRINSNPPKKPLNTPCAEVGYEGLDGTIWDLAGIKPVFVKQTAAITSAVEDVTVPGTVVNGETVYLDLPAGVTFTVDPASDLTVTDDEITVSADISEAFTFTIAFVWNGRVLRSENVTVSVMEVVTTDTIPLSRYGALKDGAPEANTTLSIDLTDKLDGHTLAAGGLWTITGTDNAVTINDVTVSGNVASFSADALSALPYGSYTISYVAADNTLKAFVPIEWATKVLSSPEDVQNFGKYAEKSDETTWRATGKPIYKYDGYFILDRNIDLTGVTLTTDYVSGWTSGEMNVNPSQYGFTGTFDGRGYALIGGTFSQGGMFGAVAASGTVKNTAFIDCVLDKPDSMDDTNCSAVIGSMLAGTVDNCLFDIVSKTGESGPYHGIARHCLGGTMTDCIVYYNFATGGSLFYYVWGEMDNNVNGTTEKTPASVVSNVYVFTLTEGTSSDVTTPDYAAARYAYDTPCSEVSFSGLDAAYWDLSGTRATFRKAAEITGTQSFMLGKYTELQDEVPVESETFTLDLSATMEDKTLASGGTWQLVGADVTDIGSAVTVADNVVTLSADTVNQLPRGQYILTYKAADLSLRMRVPVVLATKVLSLPEDVRDFQKYAAKTDETNWQNTENNPIYKYDGYFVLDRNIDLTGITLGTDFYSGYTSGAMNVLPWQYGFTGTFDGCGYTLSNGTFGRGGMFGAVALSGVVKNVAFVNARLDMSEVFNDSNAQTVIGNAIAGQVDNCLFDITGKTGDNDPAYGLTRQITSGHITNCVLYYNFAAGYPVCNVATAYEERDGEVISDSVLSNLYVFTDAPHSVPDLRVSADIGFFAYNVTCAEAEMSGLNTSVWDLTGDKATFAKADI